MIPEPATRKSRTTTSVTVDNPIFKTRTVYSTPQWPCSRCGATAKHECTGERPKAYYAYSQEYEKQANALARSFVDIKPCPICWHPKVFAFDCTFCNDG